MKKIILLAILMGTMLPIHVAGAQSLEDILKEKGIITKEEYEKVTQKSPVSYILGEGFTFVAPGERFKLNMATRLQFRYTYTDKDLVNGDVSDIENWQVRRLKFSLAGYIFTKDIPYRMEVNFAESTSPTNRIMQTIRFGYRFLDEIQIQAGQYRVPFLRQWETNDEFMEFVEAFECCGYLQNGL